MRVAAATHCVSYPHAEIRGDFERRERPAGGPRTSTRESLMPEGSILVADDDAAIRTVLNQALSRAGYEVRSTGNAATLWRWISQGDGDLMMSDVVVPEESAFGLVPRIKEGGPEVPSVVMSAQDTFVSAI